MDTQVQPEKARHRCNVTFSSRHVLKSEKGQVEFIWLNMLFNLTSKIVPLQYLIGVKIVAISAFFFLIKLLKPSEYIYEPCFKSSTATTATTLDSAILDPSSSAFPHSGLCPPGAVGLGGWWTEKLP